MLLKWWIYLYNSKLNLTESRLASWFSCRQLKIPKCSISFTQLGEFSKRLHHCWASLFWPALSKIRLELFLCNIWWKAYGYSKTQNLGIRNFSSSCLWAIFAKKCRISGIKCLSLTKWLKTMSTIQILHRKHKLCLFTCKFE